MCFVALFLCAMPLPGPADEVLDAVLAGGRCSTAVPDPEWSAISG